MDLEFTQLTVRLLLLFFPGIIATIIINSLTERKEESIVYFFIKSFINGLISYLFVYILVGIINSFLKVLSNWLCVCNNNIFQFKLSFLECLMDGNLEFNFIEIIFTTVISVFVAIIITLCQNKKVLHKIAKRIGISNKFADIDVWSYLMTSLEDDWWVVIRNYDLDLMYEGWIKAFSSTYKENELLLTSVTVYRNSTAEKLYEMDAMYLTRNSDNITIELRKVSEGGK